MEHDDHAVEGPIAEAFLETDCTHDPTTCGHSRPDPACPEHPQCELTADDCDDRRPPAWLR
jgi:hypothetical protein